MHSVSPRAEADWPERRGRHLLVAQEEPMGGHMQDARTVEPLEPLLGGICSGEVRENSDPLRANGYFQRRRTVAGQSITSDGSMNLMFQKAAKFGIGRQSHGSR
jgi:hypothetical protein